MTNDFNAQNDKNLKFYQWSHTYPNISFGVNDLPSIEVNHLWGSVWDRSVLPDLLFYNRYPLLGRVQHLGCGRPKITEHIWTSITKQYVLHLSPSHQHQWNSASASTSLNTSLISLSLAFSVSNLIFKYLEEKKSLQKPSLISIQCDKIHFCLAWQLLFQQFLTTNKNTNETRYEWTSHKLGFFRSHDSESQIFKGNNVQYFPCSIMRTYVIIIIMHHEKKIKSHLPQRWCAWSMNLPLIEEVCSILPNFQSMDWPLQTVEGESVQKRTQCKLENGVKITECNSYDIISNVMKIDKPWDPDAQ